MEDALFKKDFIILKKKFYLADTRYHNINYLLYLYCGIKYYLKKQAMAGQKSIKKEELFNLYYFNLRNIIQKIFNVTKHQFQIFETLAEFTIEI